jgi:uncharacterized protein YkwD
MNYRGSILSSTQVIRIIRGFILAGLVLWFGVNRTLAGNVELGTPPVFTPSQTLPVTPGWERSMELARFAGSGGLTVNPQNRAASRAFFNTHYLALDAAINWTGDRSDCKAGDTDLSFRDAVLLRLNYYRAMAGVPATVTFSDTYNAMDQQAALMMSVNAQLSHDPPATWTCYSADGDLAASNSNLALGLFGRNAIDAYMKDPGSGNGFVGHRRWIFYPQTQIMGTGDLPFTDGWAANSLWVIDYDHYSDPRPPTREEFVAWPPPGYVPYQVVFPRWSFSYAGANFSSATVTMTQGGAAVPVVVEALTNGYGENTLVWIPLGLGSSQSWPKPSRDTSYLVTISNIVIGTGTRTFTYQVSVFDPATASPRALGGALMLLLD